MSYWRQRCGKKGLRATDCVSDDTSASVNREKGAWIREYIGTENGGGGGIRTLVTGSTGETVFETAAFNHSATPPHGAPCGCGGDYNARHPQLPENCEVGSYRTKKYTFDE